MKRNQLSVLEDDGLGSLVTVMERAREGQAPQSLTFRVGPVWLDGPGPEPEPAIWVEYQDAHLASSVRGPVLIDLRTWGLLDDAIKCRAKRWRRRKGRRGK